MPRTSGFKLCCFRYKPPPVKPASHDILTRNDSEIQVDDEALLDEKDYKRLQKMHAFYKATSKNKRRCSQTPSIASVVENVYEEFAEEVEYEPDKPANRMSIKEQENIGRSLTHELARRGSKSLQSSPVVSGSSVASHSGVRRTSISCRANDHNSPDILNQVKGVYEDRTAQLEQQLALMAGTGLTKVSPRNSTTGEEASDSRRASRTSELSALSNRKPSTPMPTKTGNVRRLSMTSVDLCKDDTIPNLAAPDRNPSGSLPNSFVSLHDESDIGSPKSSNLQKSNSRISRNSNNDCYNSCENTDSESSANAGKNKKKHAKKRRRSDANNLQNRARRGSGVSQ